VIGSKPKTTNQSTTLLLPINPRSTIAHTPEKKRLDGNIGSDLDLVA